VLSRLGECKKGRYDFKWERGGGLPEVALVGGSCRAEAAGGAGGYAVRI